MRLVLDTNVAASGLLWGGTPAQLLDAAQIGEVELFTSAGLLAELAGILKREKFAKALAATGLSVEELVLGYAALATVIMPAEIPPTIAADPDDDQVLACALAAKADSSSPATSICTAWVNTTKASPSFGLPRRCVSSRSGSGLALVARKLLLQR